MSMEFKSYKAEVLAAMELCKHEFCEGVGTLVVAEAQSIVPVGVYPDPHAGNLKKSIVSEILPNDEGIAVGVTPDAPYGLVIEKGLANHKAQPYLEPAANNSISKIVNVAERVYKQKMGG